MSMQTTENHEIWGILGGMGPLASAEFVSSIYRETFSGREQQAPRVLLLSDPTIPDRTECLLNGDHEMLLERLAAGVGQLVLMGATRIVICCMTIHPLVPRLPSFWHAECGSGQPHPAPDGLHHRHTKAAIVRATSSLA
jgi:aspartate racemase